MSDSLSPIKLDEYIDSIKNLEYRIRSIEDEMCHTLDEAHFYSEYADAAKFIDEMQTYICETQKVCACMYEFADKLHHISVSCREAAPPPFFDFIVNFDVGAWWKQAYPIIEQIATVTGAITGAAAITTAPLVFIKWMRNKLQGRKNKDEYTWVKFILNEEDWTISALSEKLDLSEDEAKKMLKGFGYKWNPQKMLYVSTENTQKLRDIDIRRMN